MIICRKCQRHHPDSARSTACACGADLRRDGIVLVQRFEPPPLDDDLDDLPPLDDEAGTESDRATPSSAPAEPAPPTPEEAAGRAPGAASRLQRRRRQGPATPGANAEEKAEKAEEPAAMPLAPPDDVAGRDLDQPSGHDATGVVDAPGGRRARSVDPRDLIAARDQHAPNVGTPPAAPAAVPAEASTQQPATAPPMEDDPLDPSGSAGRCPVCAEPNGETRRFCVACGARLSDDAAGDRGGQADDQRRGRRRPRTWRQRARAASEGRLRYGSGFATEAKARAVMLVLVGVASIVALAGPGRERVLAALGRGPTGALPASAQLLTGQGEPGEEVAGFGVANVHDDDPLTGVAVVWEPGGATEPNRIRLALEEPTAVQEVGIAAGLGDEATDAPLVRRPSLIRLCADAGACQEVSLEDSDSLHLYDVELGDDVRSIDLTVLDVHDTGVTTYPLAVISEVRIVD